MYVNAPCKVELPNVDTMDRSTRPVIGYAWVTAVICVGLSILKLVTLAPPNLTLVMFTKLVPRIVMFVPPANVPDVGDIEYNVGAVDGEKN